MEPNDGPPGWVKQLLRKRAALERVVDLPMGGLLGCGVYGCVFESAAPWVVKVTIDPDEGDVWAAIRQFEAEGHYGTDGIARVSDIVRLRPDVKWRGRLRAVHAVVREQVHPLWEGEHTTVFSQATIDRLGLPPGRSWSLDAIRPARVRSDPALPQNVRGNLQEFYSLLMGLMDYREAAQDWHRGARMKRASNRERVQDAAYDDMSRATNRMSGRIGGYIGETLLALAEHGVVLQDVHWNNVGWRAFDEIDGEELPLSIIIFDPGASPTAAREVREALVANRASPFHGQDVIAGGLAEHMGVTEYDVDPDELVLGIEEEMEHTEDPRVAKRIALDHLAEDPHYYTKLSAAGL